MQLHNFSGRRLIGAAAIACAAALLPAAALAATTAPPSWKIVKTVPGNNNPSFTAVTATGRHSAWAFEATSSPARIEKPAAWRLSGSRWIRAPFPGKASEEVTSAASTSPNDVWAVTYNFYSSRSRILSWNGRNWAVTGSFSSGFPPTWSP